MSIVPNHFPEVIDPGPTDAELAAIEAHVPRRLRVVPAPEKMVVPVGALSEYESSVAQLIGFADAVCRDLQGAPDPQRVARLAGLLRGKLDEALATHQRWARAKWSS